MIATLFRGVPCAALTALLISACATPSPYQTLPPPSTVPPSGETPVETRPGSPPTPTEEPQSLPETITREPILSPASRALVGQAQVQLASKNYAVAASSIERALRIEPGNALLWIELGKVRLVEGNYVQAENMGRKAVSMSVNTPGAQSSAWLLIAESYRARGRNIEAQEAQARAEELR